MVLCAQEVKEVQMNKEKRLPSIEGLRESQEVLKKERKRPPTEELIRIISELPEIDENNESDSEDRAAKSPRLDLDT
jgi:hypothetical protein